MKDYIVNEILSSIKGKRREKTHQRRNSFEKKKHFEISVCDFDISWYKIKEQCAAQRL